MQSACETKGLAMEVTSAKITALTTSTSTSGCTNSNANSDKMNYALQVALQTIKERCIQLQRRVAKMEEENQRLREVSSRTEGAPPLVTGINGDVLSLRAQVSELQRQKEQLEEHIGMVSNENRRLWSRLSQISKDQQQLHPVPSSPAQQNQNLVRSKTFTQHSPNPHLRQKMLSDGLKDLSLEEIALDDFGASNEELGYPYNLQKVEESTSESPDANCAQKTAKKPEMADKSLETDDSLTSELKIHESQHNGTPPSQRINIIQEKIKADAADAMEKTCPMCGKLYSSQVSFNAFREHVEMHFIDDDALDFEPAENSVERQFEFISHAVGDF
ncbi:hypothetical protein M5D96_001803 [Drosophila gunungcola]|uniref:UBZ1-type domain-containing protein n=1 Tax=Drosophila gunungcola TaxID=103775 RepID=A0A9Q0BVP1_9MUSC|nr:hypothetical protein M5D96_001803 [Drosophila gunungcola]